MGFDIKRMDIYRKVPKDLTQPTVTGAVVSICCVVFIVLMLGTELVWFIRTFSNDKDFGVMRLTSPDCWEAEARRIDDNEEVSMLTIIALAEYT